MNHEMTVLRDYEKNLGSCTCCCGKWCWTFSFLLPNMDRQALEIIENEHRNHIVEATKLELLEESIRSHRPKIEVMEPMRTLRDEFAMAALNGSLANSRFDTDFTMRQVAKACYVTADAMMEARKK
jgi:hypothetical protein